MPYSSVFCPVFHYKVKDTSKKNKNGMTEAQGGGFEDKLIKRKNFEQCLAILKDR